MKKLDLSRKHFQDKPISWWPFEERFPADDFVFSKLKKSKQLKVIEIGPGRGRLTFPLRDLGHEMHPVELNPKFIKYCMKKDTKNIYFFNGDGKELPFKEGIFDYALCIEVIMHLPEPALVLKELSRVLKPEGKLMIMFLRKYTKDYFKILAKVILNRYKHDLDYRYNSWSEIKKMARQSGFEIEEIYNKRSVMPYLILRKK
jgi:ubiquinone/menaquinone biosynthesis C-methylase UbiE